jgi:hypothetical protein
VAPRRLALLGAPTFFALVVVLNVYASSSSHWTEILRTLAVVTVGALLLTGLAHALVRDDVIAAALASAAVLLVLTPVNWPLVAGAAILAVLALTWRRRRNQDPLQPIGRALAFVAGVMLLVSIVRIGITGTVTPADFAPVAALPPPQPADDLPNVYVLLLDGYPRQDSLADIGYDNGPFIAALADLGFEVHADARSRYPRTELAITSMLSRTAPDGLGGLIVPPDNDYVVARRFVRRDLLPNVSGPADLRAAGYRLVYSGPPLRHVTPAGWHEDRTLHLLESFEIAVLQRTVLAPLAADWVMDQHRAWIDATLQAWTQDAGVQPGQFVFAHLLAPHAPYVYAAGGREADLPECWLTGCSIYAAREWHLSPEELAPLLTANVDSLNRRLLPVIRQLVEDDPDATVVLLSDHGAAIESSDTPERSATFFAARTPGRAGLFDGRAGPDGLVYALLGDD